MICVLPDTNVLLHARKLVSLPWKELFDGDIEVVFVGPVLTEIDKHKIGQGRLRRRASDVSAEIREVLGLPGRTKVLREKGPRLTMRIVPGLDLRSPLHESLDLSIMDHAIANHALNLTGKGHDVRILTHDTIASLVAEGAGVQAVLLPDTWLLAPEPDDNEKKLKRAQAEIELLRSQEPAMKVGFLDFNGQAIDRLTAQVRRYPPLLDHQIAELVDLARAVCPLADDFGPESLEEALAEEEKANPTDSFKVLSAIARSASFNIETLFQPASEDAIRTYTAITYPQWLKALKEALATFHQRFDRHDVWPGFDLVMSNDGTRPAESVLIALDAKGPLRLGRPPVANNDGTRPSATLGLPKPPTAPRSGILRRDRFAHALAAMQPKYHMRALDHVHDVFPLPRIRHDPAELSWSPERGETASSQKGCCGVWRHLGDERRERFFVEAKGRLDEPTAARGLVELQLSAHNISEATRLSLAISIEVKVGDTFGFARTLVEELAFPRLREED